MPVIPLTDLADKRLEPYHKIKDRELAAAGDLFVAEGLLVTQRLLRSPYPCLSVLCAQRKLPDILPDARPDTPIYVVPDPLLHDIVGYKFHTGALAVGRRLPAPSLESLLAGKGACTLVVLPSTNNSENLGSIARISAAFGVDAFLLGEECADPFYRRSLRVSMGTIFSLPLYRSSDLRRDLVRLRDDYGVELAATVLDPAAAPLAAASRPPRLALLFGSEADGLPPDYLALCQHRLTIPMSLGTDSLNVSMSAAVFLYHFTQLTRP
jgi:tRNA G18 (ribose-2'-O)-methylase SpoU